MLGVDHARFEVVDPILRTDVLLGVFELLYEASVITANVKLLASFTLLLAAGVIILVGDVLQFLAFPATPRHCVAFFGGLALVEYENHVAFPAISSLLRSHVIVKLLIGVKTCCAALAFDVDTRVVVVVLLADALLALTAPLVVVYTIVCEHLYVVNKVIMALLDIPADVDNFRLINICFGLVYEAHTARRYR
jgi:hypothetical protein